MSIRTRSSRQSTATNRDECPGSDTDSDDAAEHSEYESGAEQDDDDTALVVWTKEALAERKVRTAAARKLGTDFMATILRQIKASDTYTLALFGSSKNPPMKPSEAIDKLHDFMRTRQMRGGTEEQPLASESPYKGKKLLRRIERLRAQQKAIIAKGMNAQWSSWPEVKRKAPELKGKSIRYGEKVGLLGHYRLFRYHQHYFIMRDIMRKAAELEKNRAMANAASFQRKPPPLVLNLPSLGGGLATPPPSGSATPSSASIDSSQPSVQRTGMLAVKLERLEASLHTYNTSRASSPPSSPLPDSPAASNIDQNHSVAPPTARAVITTARNGPDAAEAVPTPLSQRPLAVPTITIAQKRKTPVGSVDTENQPARPAVRRKSSDALVLSEQGSAPEPAQESSADQIIAGTTREHSIAPASYLQRTVTAMDMPPPPVPLPSPSSSFRAGSVRPQPAMRPNATPQWGASGSATPNPYMNGNETPRLSFHTHRYDSQSGGATPGGFTPRWSGGATPLPHSPYDEQPQLRIGRPFNPHASPYVPLSAPHAWTPRWAGNGAATPAPYIRKGGSATPNSYAFNNGGVTPNPYGPRLGHGPTAPQYDHEHDGWASAEQLRPRQTSSLPGHQDNEPQSIAHDKFRAAAQVNTGGAPHESGQAMSSASPPCEEKAIGPPMIATIDWRKFIFDAELFRLLSTTPAMARSIRADSSGSNGPGQEPADGSDSTCRPRWKVERDLYVAVQAVDPTKTWLNLAVKSKWIKQIGSSYHCGVDWTEDVHNPIRDRLDHWKKVRDSAFAKGQVDAFNETCPYSSILAELFDLRKVEPVTSRGSELEPAQSIEPAPARASYTTTVGCSEVDSAAGGEAARTPITAPLEHAEHGVIGSTAAIAIQKQVNLPHTGVADMRSVETLRITPHSLDHAVQHRTTSDGAKAGPVSRCQDGLPSTTRQDGLSSTTRQGSLALVAINGSIPVGAANDREAFREETAYTSGRRPSIPPAGESFEEGECSPISSTPEAVAIVGRSATLASKGLPVKPANISSPTPPRQPKPESHWSPPSAPAAQYPVTPQDWLDFSHATIVPQGWIRSAIARAYIDVRHPHKHSNVVHDVKVDMLLDAVRAMYLRRDSFSGRFPRHTLLFNERTLGDKFGIMSGCLALVRSACLQRISEHGEEPHLFGHRDRDYFEVYFHIPIKPVHRKLHKTRIQPISLLEYLRLLIKHYIRTA